MPVSASVNYHIVKPEPQAFVFDVDGIVGNLISPELVPTDVEVLDLRDQSRIPEFDTEGIEFIHQPSGIENFQAGTDWEPAYNAALLIHGFKICYFNRTKHYFAMQQSTIALKLRPSQWNKHYLSKLQTR